MSVDLKSRYLGLELANPIVASASPLTGSVDSLKRLQEAAEGARSFLSAGRIAGKMGGQKCPRSFMLTRCGSLTAAAGAPL